MKLKKRHDRMKKHKISYENVRQHVNRKEKMKWKEKRAVI